MVRYLSLPESERAAMIPVLAALFGFNAVETAHVVAAATPQQGGLRGWVFGTPRTPSMATPSRVPAHLSTPFARAHLASEPRVGCAAAAGGGGGGGGGGHLRGPPPSASLVETAETAEDALRKKVDKLRWLLSCANNEIKRLKQEPRKDTQQPNGH